MKFYRIKINLRSSYITPWQSDTIMGSLCWVIRQTQGEKALADFLERCLAGDYPFVVSDCFPGDLLPRPLAGSFVDACPRQTRKEELDRFTELRKAKKTNYASVEEFNNIVTGGEVNIGLYPDGVTSASIMHNSISRLSNTVLEGSLFEEQEFFSTEKYLSLYALINDDWVERFSELLAVLAARGFGRRISVGKGAFAVGPLEIFKELVASPEPNAVVMLSNYIPAADDPVEGQYRLFIKYGKLGSEFTFLPNPFKKPVMMFKPGSVFWDNKPRQVYGRTVQGVSVEKKEIVQFGCSIALPASIKKP